MGSFDNRFVSLTREGTTYGGAAASNAAARYGEVDDESFAGRYDLIDRADISRYGISKSVVGREFADGSVNLAMQADDFLGMLLLGVFPTDTVDDSGSPEVHTFTEAGTFPTFTVKVQRDTHVHTFGGMVIDRLSFSASMNEYVMVSADFVGQPEDHPQTIAAANLTAGFSALDAMHFVNADVHFEGSTASPNVKSFSVDINLNRDTDNAHGLGDSGYTIAPPPQRREVSGSIEFIKPGLLSTSISEPLYDDLVYDNNAVKDGSGASPAIKAVFSDGTNSLELHITKVVYEAPETSVSARDTQTMTVNFRGLFDAGESEMMTAILKNQQATAYSSL